MIIRAEYVLCLLSTLPIDSERDSMRPEYNAQSSRILPVDSRHGIFHIVNSICNTSSHMCDRVRSSSVSLSVRMLCLGYLHLNWRTTWPLHIRECCVHVKYVRECVSSILIIPDAIAGAHGICTTGVWHQFTRQTFDAVAFATYSICTM